MQYLPKYLKSLLLVCYGLKKYPKIFIPLIYTGNYKILFFLLKYLYYSRAEIFYIIKNQYSRKVVYKLVTVKQYKVIFDIIYLKKKFPIIFDRIIQTPQFGLATFKYYIANFRSSIYQLVREHEFEKFFLLLLVSGIPHKCLFKYFTRNSSGIIFFIYYLKKNHADISLFIRNKEIKKIKDIFYHYEQFNKMLSLANNIHENSENTSYKSHPNTKRSIAFINQNYYQYYYLCKELRKNGWDATLYQLTPKTDSSQQFYYGSDVYLYDESTNNYHNNLLNLYYTFTTKKYKMIWSYGRGGIDLLKGCFGFAWHNKVELRFDLWYLKYLGIKFGWTPSGCLDEVKQSSIYSETNGVCDKCMWQNRKDVCSDKFNSSWTKFYHIFCDIIESVTDHITPERSSNLYFRAPLLTCVDDTIWNPQIKIPPQHKIDKDKSEIIILHAHGNLESRTNDKKKLGIKGTHCVYDAEKKLKKDGLPIKFVYCFDIDSHNMRFMQVQADIIVDQLNYGTNGAAARESMMLGKPTICYINDNIKKKNIIMSQSPLISANEENLYEILKSLITSQDRLENIQKASREYAIKWYSPVNIRKRFEKIYDRVLMNKDFIIEDKLVRKELGVE